MTNNIFRISLFAVLGISILASTACTGSNGSAVTKPESSPANPAANNATQSANAEPAKKSEYPPLAEKAAQAEMRHLDGSVSRVADRRGKVLLLNMWATWCGPCRAEMPHLVKMQDEHRDKGFEIVGLNTDDGDTKEMVEKFAADLKLNYTLVWANTEMQNALLKISNFGGIPQSFVIDRDGNLRGVFRGANPADIKKMEELVANIVNGEDQFARDGGPRKQDNPTGTEQDKEKGSESDKSDGAKEKPAGK